MADVQELHRGGRVVRLTRLGQRWWPDLGIEKRDVAAYYGAVAPVLLPHLRDRPLTIRRHFNGPRSPFEWVKDAPPDLPPWIPVCPQPAKSRDGALVRYPVVADELGLLWLLEFGAIDFHVWTSRCDRPDRPDVVVFDLDPAAVPFADVVRAARLLKEALDALGLDSFPMTSGGEGLHVRIPIARRHDYPQVREFCRLVAEALAATSSLVTLERRPAARRGVFVDVKMNGHGQQIVGPVLGAPTPGRDRRDAARLGRAGRGPRPA